MFARFCGFGPGHKSTRNLTQMFRDDIKDAFGLTDNSEVVSDDAEDVELDGGDGDVEVDEEEEGEEHNDLASEDSELDSESNESDDDLLDLKDEDEDDGGLDGLVDRLGYDAL